MKILAACVFAIGLMLRAVPICAAPVQTETIVMMAGCEGVPDHHDGQGGRKRDDAARSCHACAFPPVTIAVLSQPVPTAAILSLSTIEQIAGGVIKPPTPPPRKAARIIFSTYNWS